jgi:membrane-associated phospholipid phosphatase
MEKIKSFPGSGFFVLIFSLLLVWGSPGATAQSADIRLLRDIQNTRTTSGDKMMHSVSNSVYALSVAAVAGEFIYGYAAGDKEMQRNAWQMAAGLGATEIITFALKDGVQRRRPFVKYPDITPYNGKPQSVDYSFPSGHTSTAFSIATSLSLQYPKWYVIAPSFLYAGTVGYSRMYLGMHYPTDVLAGAAIGAGTSWLSYQGMKWLQHRKHKTTLEKQDF